VATIISHNTAFVKSITDDYCKLLEFLQLLNFEM